MLLPELGEQRAQGVIATRVDNGHGLGVPGLGTEHLFVRGKRRVAARVDGGGGENAGDLPGDPLDPPEAAAREHDFLRPLGPVHIEDARAEHEVRARERVGVVRASGKGLVRLHHDLLVRVDEIHDLPHGSQRTRPRAKTHAPFAPRVASVSEQAHGGPTAVGAPARWPSVLRYLS